MPLENLSKLLARHLLEWPKCKTLKTPNNEKDVKLWELSFIASKNAKWYVHFRRQFNSFLQDKIQQLLSLVFTKKS